MYFRAYEYVLTLAEEKSFSKAAKRLFISQPSLSQYISRIENELGVVLFERNSIPLMLTYEGECYVETAKKIINIHRELLNTYDDARELKKGRLKIGITTSKAGYPLPVILPVFQRQYPQVELSIKESSSADLEEFLEKGLVDVCILNLPITSGNIASEPILTEKILLAVPPAHKWARSEKKLVTYEDIRQLDKEPFILLHPGQRLRQIANDVFVKAGLKPRILMETRNIETSVKLAAAGAGFAFAPETFVSYANLGNGTETGTLRYIPVHEPHLTWTVGVAYQKERYIPKAARAFMDVTKDVMGSMMEGL